MDELLSDGRLKEIIQYVESKYTEPLKIHQEILLNDEAFTAICDATTDEQALNYINEHF